MIQTSRGNRELPISAFVEKLWLLRVSGVKRYTSYGISVGLHYLQVSLGYDAFPVLCKPEGYIIVAQKRLTSSKKQQIILWEAKMKLQQTWRTDIDICGRLSTWVTEAREMTAATCWVWTDTPPVNICNIRHSICRNCEPVPAVCASYKGWISPVYHLK